MTESRSVFQLAQLQYNTHPSLAYATHIKKSDEPGMIGPITNPGTCEMEMKTMSSSPS